MGRRHLTPSEAREALRNGRAIEQWLKHWIENGDRLIRWMRIHRDPSEGYGLTVFDVIDEGSETFLDLYEFHALDPDEPYGQVKYFQEWENAWEAAIKNQGADEEKFVSDGMIQEEYFDLVKREGYWTAK
jgi:hypothetical protein